MGARASGGIPVTLRAVHDGRAIEILATWPNLSSSNEQITYTVDPKLLKESKVAPASLANDRVAWVWDRRGKQYYRAETPSDFFALKFSISGAADACMMSGSEGTYDVWQWRDGWTHVTGYADDRLMNVTRTEPTSGDFRVYPISKWDDSVAEKGDQIFIQWHEDKGDLPYELLPRPARLERPIMPAIRARPPTGSAGDVFAEAVDQQGAWALEIWRLLKTRNADDYQFEGKGPHLFSIAVSDGQEGQAHFTSDLIRLYLD